MTPIPGKIASIFRVALAVPLYRQFDYLPPDEATGFVIEPGLRLQVPFGKSSKVGYLIEVVENSDVDREKLKRVTRILDRHSLLSNVDIRLLNWASRYYHHPLGEVFNTAFPVTLRQGKIPDVLNSRRYTLTELGKTCDRTSLQRAPGQKTLFDALSESGAIMTEPELAAINKNWRSAIKSLLAKGLVEQTFEYCEPNDAKPAEGENFLRCNSDQESAISAVCDSFGRFGVFLLDGVTGSGKTEVYMQIISRALEQGRQILVLLPEITLTPQLEDRFRKRFSTSMAIFHSKLTHKERQKAWLGMQQGSCSILLGTRSALFTPIKNPGLIIIDEEHDSSFKQQEGFRFSARDVAVVRAKLLNIPLVLGSATPSLESLYNVQCGRYRPLRLAKRAGNAVEPLLQLLDIRNKRMIEGLSEPLLKEMRNTLAKREQVLLFLNRRGFAPTLICHGCGWVARCQSCDANLVIHFQEKKLRCHHCGREQPLIQQCRSCSSDALTPLGLGTERVETVLSELFPEYSVVRLDRDSIRRKGSLEAFLRQINQGQADIVLGTQMLAKGHHFANVTLVAILDVDSGLFSIDFRAAEKLAQLIVQVSGRAGRAEKRGKVILQTRHPEHPLLTTLIDQGYRGFSEIALAERKEASLPPYCFQALLRAQATSVDNALQFLSSIKILADQLGMEQTQTLGPVPAPMPRRAGLFRYQLLFQSSKRSNLHALLDVLVPKIETMKSSRQVRWSIDVDPMDLY